MMTEAYYAAKASDPDVHDWWKAYWDSDRRFLGLVSRREVNGTG